jgi:hypothetical protein
VLATRRNRGFLAVATAAAFIAALLLASPALAANPPGNNGTVKIDREPFDDAPNNEPHVGCTFQVDFYGYDEGDLNAAVKFEAWAPTQRESDSQVLLTDTVFIGEDSNAGGGSIAGLDASETYTLDLSGITPHPKQGVHVKLTINAEGSQGADVKHKVFWVTGCGGGEETTTTKSGGTTTTTTMGGGNGGGGSSSTTVLGGGGGAGSGGSLPFTGSSSVPMVIAGLLMVGLGAASLLVNRLRQRQNDA